MENKDNQFIGANGEEATKDNSFKSILTKIDVRAYAMIAGLILIWIMFSILTDGTFLTQRNLTNLLIQMSVVAILGTGMVLVIVTGHIDLSVGSLAGLIGGLAAALMVWYDWGTLTTIVTALLVGIALGAFQGFFTAYLNVPAFIVTLGGLMAFRGILLGITNGVTIAPMNDGYKALGQAYFTNSFTLLSTVVAVSVIIFFTWVKIKNNRKYNINVDSKSLYVKPIILSLLIVGFVSLLISYRGMPVPVFIMLILILIFTFLAEKTKIGRSIYAIGGNLQAAKFSGIKVKKVVLIVFALNGLMAAIAGIILSARLNAGSPSAGNMMELDAIAAAVIGGTSLSGGVGRVFGAILGASIMVSLDNGMSLLNVEAFWQYIVKGSILVLAVWFDVASKKKRK